MFPGTRRTVVTLAMLAAALTGLTACGSDGESVASDPAGGTSASASASASDSATASPSESPSATSSLPSTDDPTEAIPTPTLPTCDSVWVEGQKFPRSYEGCTNGTEVVAADGLYCEFGKPLFSYGKHFYAVQNGPVNRTEKTLAKDAAFQTAQRRCGG